MLQNRVGEASGTLLQHCSMLNIFLKDFLKIIPVEIATGLIRSFIMNNKHLNNNHELMIRCVGGSTRTFSTPLNSQMNFRKKRDGKVWQL
jgi:hypothetical protein